MGIVVLLQSNNMRLFLMKVAPGDASADSDVRIFSFFFYPRRFFRFLLVGSLSKSARTFPFFVWASTSLLSFFSFSSSSPPLSLFHPLSNSSTFQVFLITISSALQRSCVLKALSARLLLSPAGFPHVLFTLKPLWLVPFPSTPSGPAVRPPSVLRS